MVYDQGEIVDSIEAHVEEAQTGVQEGVQQLSRAATYQVNHPNHYNIEYNPQLPLVHSPLVLCTHITYPIFIF